MDKFNKNRKGFMLAEETIKVIIAIICIVFLFYLLTSIYNASTSAKKIEEAKASLARIETITLALNEGEIDSQDIPNPQGWYLYGFTGASKPNSCAGTNCLCICDSVSSINIFTSQVERCDNKGACINIPNLASSNLDLKIGKGDSLLFVGIKKENGNIIIGELK
jgi:hypothetical protein